MATYEVSYRCGHTGEVSLLGPMKKRQYILEEMTRDLCPECEAKAAAQRPKKEDPAIARDRENGYVDLEGTEKQIKVIAEFRRDFVEELAESVDFGVAQEKADLVVSHFKNISSCRYWFDEIMNKRVVPEEDFVEEMYEKLAAAQKAAAQVSEAKKEEETVDVVSDTVYPANSTEKNVVSIVEVETEGTKTLRIDSDKDDRIIEIAKTHRLRWTGRAWALALSEMTGTFADRAAQLGNDLLNAGFPIRIQDETIRKNAVAGIFQPRHYEWIFLRTSSTFAIRWDGKDDHYYEAALKLPSAKWRRGIVEVKTQYFDEIEEFVDLFGFRLTTKAQAKIQAERQGFETASRVQPAVVEKKLKKKKNGLLEILQSSREVLPDLREDDD